MVGRGVSGAEGAAAGVKGARLEEAPTRPNPRPRTAAGAGMGVRGGGRRGAAVSDGGAVASSRVG